MPFQWMTSMKNRCTVKYIHLRDVPPADLHSISDYEMHKTTVFHSTFNELHTAVFEACPMGWVCQEPLALHHEVMWSTGVVSNGVVLSRDHLKHAIEESEYGILWRTSSTCISICVDIEPATLAVTI